MTDYNGAITIVMTLLKSNREITENAIFEKVEMVKSMLSTESSQDKIDWELLKRDVESRCNVKMGKGAILEDQEISHKIWLPSRKSSIEWKFWNRYKRYLEEEKGWSYKLIMGIDSLTDQILERLEDPQREGPWDRRGMAVGQVQSGKTANYTGLICKAVDSGYKLIIVLAGQHKSLRSQTQARLDMEFLGFDTRMNRAFNQENLKIGVGKLIGQKLLPVNSLTSSDDNGDFTKKIASQGAVMIGSDPILLVVKKNKSVLKNLLNWATSIHGVLNEKGVKIVSEIPLLLIDDEADNASINTNGTPVDENRKVLDDCDATAINGLIRQLLNSFEKTAYIGYTATPFGNIFIMPSVESDKYGDDLFPKNFIINLPAPSNHIGPAKVFGLDTYEQAGIKEEEGISIIRIVNDFEELIPTNHKKYHEPLMIPESLKKAIKCFVISCAARAARKQEKEHNSMLIHVTRYTHVQMKIYDLVKEELEFIRRRIEYGDGGSKDNLIEELEYIWKEDYVKTTEAVKRQIQDPKIIDVEWEDVKRNLFNTVAKINVKLINGTANDLLDYDSYSEGGSFIAIGGDKLSRGLTLEGLSISYYLRASRMYDTLMQMGRWFGYRPGYADLCRLYTSEELVTWYKYITMASEELRNDLNYMAALNKTPEDYGLRVRTHPGELLITAVNKMRNGTPMKLSYAGHIIETVVFNIDDPTVEHNFKVLSQFIQQMGTPEDETQYRPLHGNFLWNNVPTKYIIDLLNEIIIHPDSRKANPKILIDYIEAQMEINELKMWSVCLVSSNKKSARHCNIGSCSVGLTQRQKPKEDLEKYSMANGRLISPADELIDLSEDQIERARQEMYEKTGKRPDVPSGRYIRNIRSSKTGLLIIYPLDNSHEFADTVKPVVGLAFSFPGSENARTVDYKVNNIYWEQEFGVFND
ncbi:Z1 domain-containing protein [Methanosarcina mazei]|jgi:hypothetical protein|uniref:Endonuclease n=1 Tax=Methanosarcina mazei TaxID=2209 RepID=A0A0F8JXA3_METMZ|nr:Z1 domain-containing protein [Methanosarcina mazei]KKG13676.1 endonuclease [Methanosarcina mazei]KKG28511.1 endonuclease [Methanosarcina mazei]KKG40839.1 endonuclease [Methanosarcina mazei]KKG45589.1 endonuclease [Methanosarcina mazei]KKG46794.1 endonuclease [Methanosarcina mazei]